jgi:hypothetical protein
MKVFHQLILFSILTTSALAQEKYNVACVAFYNFENLFDTIDSPDTDDFEFTPYGPNLYNSTVYNDKLSKLAKVIHEVGKEFTPDGPTLLGVAEIENRSVLEDFAKQPLIASRDYQVIHVDSKDGRGVDVALLYQPKYFTPASVHTYSLPTNEPGDAPRYSRDILFVTGRLDGELIGISVNHWPSRRGGEQTTAHLRIEAGKRNRMFIDSIAKAAGVEKFIVMGDLNDDPINESVKKELNTARTTDQMSAKQMYNPFEEYYRKGLGTTAYQDAWSLFDQIILTSSLAKNEQGLRYYKSGIHNPAYMKQASGRYAGYPLRTYANGVYAGGYSDHFPVYVLLVKPAS